ncbi:MAG: GvpL/GvpF family gas vesicle protein [Chloroflexi bacterium]|nr:GvpL/GvpF family gas vesicle protein [Chloroflexota bacterium]
MSATPPSSSAYTYVYCIVQSEPFENGAPPFRAVPVGGKGNTLYTIHFMDLAAVVSDSPVARYDIARENTMAHQLVIEEAMTRSAVLPVRFGTVASNPQAVQEKLLKRKFGEFHQLMLYVGDREELGLKVFWSRDRLFAEIAAEDGRIRALRDNIAGRSPDETHYQRIQLGQLTEEAIIRKRDAEAEAILEAVRPLAVQTRVNKILTDIMILNAAFLVERAHEKEFDATVNALDEAQAGRSIFKYAGPLPPYNFVNIVVHWQED